MLCRVDSVCYVALFPSNSKPTLIGSLILDSCVLDWELAATTGDDTTDDERVVYLTFGDYK